jgi:uncharacterized damage-inducible protein DinB
VPEESASPELRLLERERARLLAWVERVPEPLRSRRPTPQDWSVVEILEHLTQVEQSITSLLTARGREPPAEPAAAETLAAARLTPERAGRIRDRTERLEAPERVRPAGQLDASEALQSLAAVRAALLAAFLAADPSALDGVVRPHPVVGLLTLRGWVQFVAHHEARHSAQVADVAAALGVQ